MRSFGKAADYYRARIQTLIVDDQPSIDWREDILYRQTLPGESSSRILYLVQVIRTDDYRVFDIKNFTRMDEAEEFKKFAEELLEDLTVNQFQERFSDKLD